MLGTSATDWSAIFVGLASVVSAIFAGLAALRAQQIHTQVKSPNGETRTSGEVLHDVADIVENTAASVVEATQAATNLPATPVPDIPKG